MNDCNFLSLKQPGWSPNEISAIKYAYTNGESNDYRKIGRRSNLIHYVCDKESRRRYILEDGSVFYANCGDIIFLPENSKYYTDVFTDNIMGTGYCISFKAESLKSEFLTPQIIGHTESRLFIRQLNELVNTALLHKDDTFTLNSLFFKLLSTIDNIICGENEIPSAIKPALDYIDAHITEKIKLEKLSELCFLSESQFRRNFRKYTNGISPKSYILRQKLEYAKNYINSTEITVESLSEMLGFYDASALCNAYKKMFGENISKQSKNYIDK